MVIGGDKVVSTLSTEVNVNHEKAKRYRLMNKDIVTLEFTKFNDLMHPYRVDKVVAINQLPFMLKSDASLISYWLESRTIPTNREHIDKVLESMHIDSKDKFNLLLVNHATSLNDTFWIKECNEVNIYGQSLCWEDISLYRGFKDHLGIITFFGNTLSLGGRLKTPETTTQGMLRKAWRYLDNKVFMYKANTHGFANTGNEMYSEVVAYEIGKLLNLPIVKYEYAQWLDTACVRCKMFTSEEYGYLTMTEFLSAKLGSQRLWTYSDIAKLLPKEIVESINDMIIFDFIIENEDRHFSNFGLLVNNYNTSIISLVPLFDHGYSLLHFEMEQDLRAYDYNKSSIGTFNLQNKYQAVSILSMNAKKYKRWANKLATHIDSIDFTGVPSYRAEAMRKLITNRCKFIQEFKR